MCGGAPFRDYRNRLVQFALSGSLCPVLCALSVVWRAVGCLRSTIPRFCVFSGVCGQTWRKRHLTTRLYCSYTPTHAYFIYIYLVYVNIYIYIYIYIYMCVCVCIYMCVCMLWVSECAPVFARDLKLIVYA